MTVPEQRIIEFLNLLGIQNDCAVGLKHLGNQIYFQFIYSQCPLDYF